MQISAEYDGEAGGATGSGFVLDRQGHIITNNHVVADAAADDGPIEIVDQDGNRYDATIVGRSPVYDLAVLYARGAADARSPPPWAPPRALRVGEARGRDRLAPGAELHGHRRHRQRAEPPGHHRRRRPTSRPTSTPCRPTPRSTPATPAVRWSTCSARWSA